MGMFDKVDYETTCPVCGEKIDEFQTKDTGCTLETVSVSEVSTFYSDCHCGAWITYTRIKGNKFERTVDRDQVGVLGEDVEIVEIVEGGTMSSYKTAKTILPKHKTSCGGRIILGNACFKCEDCREQLASYIKSDEPGIDKTLIVGQIMDAIDNGKRTVLTGWICPTCGRGNAPMSSCCPCVPMPPITVTC